jgi:hypothetical protein
VRILLDVLGRTKYDSLVVGCYYSGNIDGNDFPITAELVCICANVFEPHQRCLWCFCSYSYFDDLASVDLSADTDRRADVRCDTDGITPVYSRHHESLS